MEGAGTGESNREEGEMGLEREYVAAETKGHLRSYMET